MGQQRVPAAGLDHPERGQQHRGGQGRDDLGVAQCETPSGVVAALDSPYTSNATPAVAVTAPGRSNRPARRPVCGSTLVARTATASPIGTLTKNHPQAGRASGSFARAMPRLGSSRPRRRNWILIRRDLADPDDLVSHFCHARQG